MKLTTALVFAWNAGWSAAISVYKGLRGLNASQLAALEKFSFTTDVIVKTSTA
jgi:hypothetical protein